MLNQPTYLFNQTTFWAYIQPSKPMFERSLKKKKKNVHAQKQVVSEAPFDLDH